jgi:hypothetical protein
MIVYKVVTKGSRYGSNAAVYIGHGGIMALKNLFKECPKLKKYFPRYSKGAEIEAVKGSVGICCFVNRTAARNFRFSHDIEEITKIIKVIGRKKDFDRNNPVLLQGCGSSPERLIDAKSREKTRVPGTITFRRIKVLE